MRELTFGYSPCPNDTFAFHAFVHGLVPGPSIVTHLDDIEALNLRAESGEAEVTKISLAAYLHLLLALYFGQTVHGCFSSRLQAMHIGASTLEKRLGAVILAQHGNQDM